MDYRMYLFIEKMFKSTVTADKNLVDKAIASHERLIGIVEAKYQFSPFANDITAASNRTIETVKKIAGSGDKYFVRYLNDEQLDDLEIITEDSWTFGLAILAGYQVKHNDKSNAGDPYVLEEVISLISWQTMSAGPESIHSIIQPKLEIFEKEATARANELSETVSAHRKLFDEQQLLHAQAAEATARAQVELTVASQGFEHKALELEDKSQGIESDIRQLRADLDAQVARFGTEAARKLWGEREKQSKWALILSSVAICLLIAAPIALAVCFTTEILHYLAQIVAASALPTIDSNGQQLPPPTDAQVTIAAVGRLVIVTVPIFLYIWAIRLVVRFNSRSLLLLDDARLRLTMLDTFFHLIEKEGAVKEDRALVLNALFRPAPGHGDNVDPPNFTELVSKAMGTGTSK
ncbi:hypothetical protein [Agrobacterium sp. Azo12]|uniref:hypothetical protein n=1 Tax=Agrobacterium sp. Azo12 TaxID=3031129 RepID=UPI0023D7D94A|nr:hypothetical protein [Agrobacterium sp. Azo12]MDO5895642.1 hypothetical protein [Agrobacterium sp. Azo12]